MTQENGQRDTVVDLSALQKQKEDATLARQKRVEPIALKILEMMLADKTVLLSDATFIEQVVKEQFEQLFKGIVYQHLQEVFNLVIRSLQASLDKAQEVKWGKKAPDVTAHDVNDVLIAADKKDKQTL